MDDRQRVTESLLHTEALLTYASREISEAFLAEAIRYLRQTQSLWLVRSSGDPPAPPGYKIIPRLEFCDYDPDSPRLSTLREQIPAGFRLRRINRELLQRCEWRDDMVFYTGSLDNFLRHDLGLCLMRGEEIIVEAYASALGDPFAEIGAITHEAQRGKGYAPIALAYLIQMLEERGYHAYWSCDRDNPASASVARKLGFKIERAYEIFEYEAKS